MLRNAGCERDVLSKASSYRDFAPGTPAAGNSAVAAPIAGEAFDAGSWRPPPSLAGLQLTLVCYVARLTWAGALTTACSRRAGAATPSAEQPRPRNVCLLKA